MGNAKDGSFRIFVYCDYRVRILHSDKMLDCSRYPKSYVQSWTNRHSCLTDLLILSHPTEINHCSCCGYLRSKFFSELFHKGEILCISKSSSTRDYDIGIFKPCTRLFHRSECKYFSLTSFSSRSIVSRTRFPFLPSILGGTFMTLGLTDAIVGFVLGQTIVDISFPPKSGRVPLNPPFSSMSREVQSAISPVEIRVARTPARSLPL